MLTKTTTKKKDRRSLRKIKVEATQECVNLLALLISLERESRPSETTHRKRLTWTELARWASEYLDPDAPDLSGQTIKAFVDAPSTTRAWRSIVPVLRALGYHADFTRT